MNETRRRMSRFLIDLAPFRRHRDFRLLFAGLMASMFGTQLSGVAISFQTYALTRSSLQVGAISIAQLAPLVLGALIGGSVGDAIDRRRMLLATSAMLSLTSGALAINAALAHPSVVVLYVVCAVAAGLGGMLSTSCTATVPAVVDRRHLVAAYASMQVVDQTGMVLGPALAGLLIGAVHLEWVYTIDAVTYLMLVAAVFTMSAITPAEDASRPGLSAAVEGFRYIQGHQALRGAYLIDLNATVFGLPRALFPALADTAFHGGAATLGYLYAAPGAGALIGALTSGWLGRIRRQGCAVIAAVCAWGAAIVAFGLVHVLWIALGLLAVAGWADVISAVLRTTILQQSVPGSFRGRIAAVQIAVVEGGPRLGDLESGAIAAAVSTGFSIVSGGIACVAGALLCALLPGLRRYGADRGQG